MKILLPDPAKHKVDSEIRSSLSFYPYYKLLLTRIQNPKEQFTDVYRDIASKLEAYPELLQPFTNLGMLEKHEQLFQLIASTILPFSSDRDLEYFALSTPYKFEFFFYSGSFSNYFNPDSRGYINFPPERPFEQFQKEYVLMAYHLIFRKFFNFEIRIPERRTNQWIDKSTGLRRYSRIHIDESFIDIKLNGELPPFPGHLIDKISGTLLNPEQLFTEYPLSLFTFEGFILRRSIADVTMEACVNEVKSAMIEMQSENPLPGYEKLRSAVETLISIKNVEVSLSPVLRLNEKFIFHNKYSGRSILLKKLKPGAEREAAYDHLTTLLSEEKRPLYVSNLKDKSQDAVEFPLAKYLENSSISCYLIAPIFHNNELSGILEAASPEAGLLNNQTIKKLEPVYAFLEMMCRNYIDQFHSEIESLILERYTALLPVVEWKFMQEAWLYLREKEKDSNVDIGEVSFDNVYPFYGAVDVKDSSNTRSSSFQKDIVDQLDLAEKTLKQLAADPQFGSNGSINRMLEKNLILKNTTTGILLAADEVKINEFLDHELNPFLMQLSETGFHPDAVKNYLNAVAPESGHLNKNRKAFEESIGKINETISVYLENEQDKIQQFYPHYFEKFRTDGVEYNIYMGQSFTPNKVFDPEQLNHIRLWQLSVMAEITQITHRLKKNIPVPLQTTQLILIYSTPICISFRKDERRFDVEGAESIRYEVLKKRIDKVKIKETGERLTKPGTIAIVYSHPREVSEYDQYFSILQQNNVISPEIERLELEDVQSISGLKAIRIHVNMEG